MLTLGNKTMIILPRILLVIVLVVSTGCVTNYQSDKITKGFHTRHGYISVTSEKSNDREYRIIANGAGMSRVEDVERIWTEFAEKVAAGRSFTKESKVEDFSYYDPSTYITFHAKRVVGIITIEQKQ